MKPFWVALSTLSCLPFSPKKIGNLDLKRSPAFYPLVGAILGIFFSLVSLLLMDLTLKALLILSLWIFLTLAFHLDGLADCLDGWFGGKTLQDRLRIMKSPSLGTYGITGIILVLLSKYILLTHLLVQPQAWKWLIAVPTAARFAASISCKWGTSPRRAKGLGKSFIGISNATFFISILLTLMVVIPILQWRVISLLGISLLSSFSLIALSKHKIGGLTGDGLGATIELSEVLGLWLCNILLPL
jgi:adenosylcobinamide-GDP ribazoletransferase